MGVIILIFFWRNMGCIYYKRPVAVQVMGLSNLLYLKIEEKNLADFLHADTNSEKLQITFIIF